MIIDGVEYIRADEVTEKPNGNRAVVVVDRGWIFAGDVTEKDGRIFLSRAVHVCRWSEIWFSGLVADNPPSDKVEIQQVPNGVDIPAASEIMRVPVCDGWGLPS